MSDFDPAGTGFSIGSWNAGVRYLKGTGFPEGVISAPVGSTYIDTAITNGASSWIKKSGTGNTGWQVLEGDTGWRNIASLINTTDFSGTNFKIRRVNNQVELIGDLGANTLSAERELTSNFALFTGFKANSAVWDRQGLVNVGGTSMVGYIKVGDNFKALFTGATQNRFRVSFSTTDAWPTTLPGVSA